MKPFPLTVLALFAAAALMQVGCNNSRAAAPEQPQPARPAIYGIPSQLTDKALEDASLEAPLVLRSLDDAKPYYDAPGLARLEALVDFDQQHILLFAWSGSGQDKLTYEVLESAPEQIAFNYEPGRTRDLRRHVYAFALRNDVTWMMRR